MRAIALLTLPLLTCLASASAQDGSAEAGQAKAAVCAACHGAEGTSANPEWPSLAAQHPIYVVRQLQAFKDGTRSNPLMNGMAAPLSAQDMADLAAWFGSQAAKGGTADPALVASGQRLYRGGDAGRGVSACIACHGPNGRGNLPGGIPALGGQHATYTAAQLKAYAAGDRRSDPNQVMRNIAAVMTPDQITAVSSYIQGLH